MYTKYLCTRFIIPIFDNNSQCNVNRVRMLWTQVRVMNRYTVLLTVLAHVFNKKYFKILRFKKKRLVRFYNFQLKWLKL